MNTAYDCWLGYNKITDLPMIADYQAICSNLVLPEKRIAASPAGVELKKALVSLFGKKIGVYRKPAKRLTRYVIAGTLRGLQNVNARLNSEEEAKLETSGFIVKYIDKDGKNFILIAGKTDTGVLYGVFHFILSICAGTRIKEISAIENPAHPLRILDHWDNFDGTIERGYAGASFFFKDNELTDDFTRIEDYARIVSSVGINGVVLNNVNVRNKSVYLITGKLLKGLAKYAEIFRRYGIRIYLCVNYASPILLDKLPTADPLDPAVEAWWKAKADEIYAHIPDFGGFLVKADSESTPGPFTYGRNHAEGANMLARALAPHDGILMWRCFVYNCKQDWRDTKTDRGRAAYDIFKPLDGKFEPNVALQIKNGPIDFQVREPVHPLFGGLENTNQVIELQVTQEYTGQQKHLCYTVPIWKDVFEFDTLAKGPGTYVKEITSGKTFGRTVAGVAGVSNTGNDPNWTGHDLAQANLYGFGRLAWNPDLTSGEIAEEWVKLTYGTKRKVVETVTMMLLDSPRVYENYTAPLGVGFMVSPNHHYGPNVDGYEFDKWGGYHRSDFFGIGTDRSVKTGTGYAGLYHGANADMYETMATCPDDLILFFHRVAYTHRLKSGKTMIQHIYDSHFEGVEQAQELVEKWKSIESLVPADRYAPVLEKLEEQLVHSKEWRDVINTTFYRKSGIKDEKGRMIYP